MQASQEKINPLSKPQNHRLSMQNRVLKTIYRLKNPEGSSQADIGRYLVSKKELKSVEDLENLKLSLTSAVDHGFLELGDGRYKITELGRKKKKSSSKTSTRPKRTTGSPKRKKKSKKISSGPETKKRSSEPKTKKLLRGPKTRKSLKTGEKQSTLKSEAGGSTEGSKPSPVIADARDDDVLKNFMHLYS